jgi:hypothetical protein
LPYIQRYDQKKNPSLKENTKNEDLSRKIEEYAYNKKELL